jgi:hypothetical protein
MMPGAPSLTTSSGSPSPLARKSWKNARTETMKAYVQSLGVADKVILPGAAPNPTAYYLFANLFVLSSGPEGFQ